LRRLAAALAAAGAFTACAEEPRWYFEVDNDVFLHTDRWYSSGVRVARVAPESGGASEWGLLHEVFTPEAKRFHAGITIDRAPTARLVASHARHWQDDARFATVEVQAGVRGEAAQGERVTRAIHLLVSAPHVDWSREVATRFDGRIAAVESRSVGPVELHYGAALGNETAFAHAGVQASWGTVRMASDVLRFAATPPFALGGPRRDGWGAFIGGNVRGVARDRLLDRGYDPTLPAAQMRRAVARIAAGAALVQGWGMVTFTLAQESRAFDTQREPQRFGSLAVHLSF
jgi:hypothetical protein